MAFTFDEIRDLVEGREPTAAELLARQKRADELAAWAEEKRCTEAAVAFVLFAVGALLLAALVTAAVLLNAPKLLTAMAPVVLIVLLASRAR